MPPHCDSMDGPVVRAAQAALDARDVDVLLPYVHESAEDELRAAFALVTQARQQPGAAREVADRFLFETAVRLHREGEGAPFTGLKPAGLDVGPIIPIAEQAIVSGSAEGLAAALAEEVLHGVRDRFDRMRHLAVHRDESVPAARRHVEAMLGLQVWAHGVHLAVAGGGHGEAGHAEGGHAH